MKCTPSGLSGKSRGFGGAGRRLRKGVSAFCGGQRNARQEKGPRSESREDPEKHSLITLFGGGLGFSYTCGFQKIFLRGDESRVKLRGDAELLDGMIDVAGNGVGWFLRLAR
jgi:hypothetical protein